MSKFVDGIRWMRNNPKPSFIGSVIGMIMLFGGVIGYVLVNRQGSYQLINIIGVIILLVINWGSPLRRSN